MSKVKVEKINYLRWENCFKLSNDTIELIVTTDVGPRIIHYGFIDGPNHMKVFEETAGSVKSKEWNIYGGHRLWHSPEDHPRTYELDNFTCEWEKTENGVIVRPPMDKSTRLAKEMEITIAPEGTEVKINHRITNNNVWDIEFSCWSLTVSAQNGRLIIPLPTTGSLYSPNRNIAFWPYTRLDDPRVKWLDRYIFLDQDKDAKYKDEPENRQYPNVPFKIGLSVPAGWVGYANFDQLFVKQFTTYENAIYPDGGHCSFEAYTNRDMLEIETLSPLKKTAPGDTQNHVEKWELFDNIKKPETQEEVDRNIVPLIKP